jgi:hypothetical protein
MAQPSASTLHVNRPLTDISVAYMQAAENYVASKVFPSIPVTKKSDSYFVFTKNDMLRDEAKPRAPHTESAGTGFGLSTAAYNADVFALHKDISDQERENADAPLNLEQTTVEFLTDRMLLRKEKQFVTDAFATSIWGTDVTPSSLWSDYTASDPITDIETGIRTIMLNTGRRPNKLVLGYDVERYLKHHPDIVDRIKYTGNLMSQVNTRKALAELFGLDEVLVAQAVNATNVEGETAAYAFTHGKHALLLFTPPSPGINIPSAGYNFEWRGVSDGMGENIGVTRFEMQHLRSERFEVQMAWDSKITGTDLGYFFNGAVA